MPSHLRLATSAGAEIVAPPATQPIRVVLADDHAMVRRTMRLLLDDEHDISVAGEAADLAAVVRHTHRHEPNVLVLDLRLPNGSTIGTIRRLRAEAPRTEIVVLTMEESPQFAQQALDAGAVGFVLKDRADSELVAAIRLAARGEEYVSPRVSAALEAIQRAAGAGELSPREIEIVRLIALGFTSREIASQLHLSRRTVETHRSRIHAKLGVTTRAELVRFALARHLVQ
ncbi:MAG TPA: response regulator transcription factor [Solirubrobacteraceae bacterium]|nr:response regulator transcription factor [Solirubrobacteraceae bacterium]